jgi:TatD DNase family protein
MHCFTESWEVAQGAMELGFYISFSGIVTFKNASALREIAKQVPLARMMIETDSPYLAPVPFRGKTNEPGLVKYVAEEIARLRSEPLERVAGATTENFFKLFNIKNPGPHA